MSNKHSIKDIIKFIAMFLIIITLLGLTIWLMPYVISLKDEAVREQLREYIQSRGVLGILIFLGLQVLQVVVALIPGEVIEVIGGLLYGTFYGYLLCSVGMLIGTAMIYYTVRALGHNYIGRVIDSKTAAKFSFLNDQKRLEIVVFTLFFIPGTPKDMLTYLMPFTKLKPYKFFLITTIARIPSIVSSTFAGDSIGSGKWAQTIVIFVVIGIIGIAGIIINEKYVSKMSGKK